MGVAERRIFYNLNSASLREYVHSTQVSLLFQVPDLLWNFGDRAMLPQIDMIDLPYLNNRSIGVSVLTVEFRLLQELLQFTVDIE